MAASVQPWYSILMIKTNAPKSFEKDFENVWMLSQINTVLARTPANI